MKITLKNVKNALNRDEMRSISGGTGNCGNQDGTSKGCSTNRNCTSGCYCSCTASSNGSTLKYCC